MPVNRKELTHKVDENGCWICTSHTPNGKGYIYLMIDKIRISAHRHSYIKHKGAIPDGLLVRHTCDVRNCINPDHLVLGTVKDNSRDMVERKRSVTGEKHNSSKLTEKQVLFIRNNPHIKGQKIADELGVRNSTIYNARNGKSWKHIESH